MSQNFHITAGKGSNPPNPPPVKTFCSSIQITPVIEPQGKNVLSSSLSNPQNGSHPNAQGVYLPRKTSDSLLIATVDGKAVGGGPGVLYSAINGNATMGPNLQGQNGARVNPSDPQVRKLVYNMYRGLLSTKHERANNIVESAPQGNVTTDEGVSERIVSMMRHQSDHQREGKMMNLGPPPPPPPPPFSTGAPAPAPKQPAEVPSKAPPPVAVPAALAGAMLKDRKPFTYTPGGLNLAEIKSPRMQRRLQRNASLEGVRPSPLAQQPPPSPGASTATIPTHGMIQVLPMPGMGMTPIVKPQPKEPSKPKRSVCGPAPPPPPFAISGDSSVEPSPSATPLTTPATTPAINSATPPSTPSVLSSTQSSSSLPLTNSRSVEPDNNNQIISDNSGLHPEMATEPGPSIPNPPPPPPTSNTLERKKYSLPSLSSQPSTSSKPETESKLSTLSNVSSSPVLNFANNLPQNTKIDTLNDIKTTEAVSVTLEANNSPSFVCPPSEEIKMNKNNENSKQTTVEHIQTNEKQSFEQPANEKQTAEQPISENLKVNCQAKNQPSINDTIIDQIASTDINNMISDKKCMNQIQDILDEIDSIQIPDIKDDIISSDKEPDVDKKIQQNSIPNEIETNTVDVFTSSSPIIIKPQVPEVLKEPVPVKKIEAREDKVDQKQVNNWIDFSPNKLPTEEAKIDNLTLNTKALFNENTQNVISSPPLPFRPVNRMVSPPTIKKQNHPNYDRMIRQTSLPAEPTSPPAVIKPGNKGSIYIPPVKQSSASVGNSRSAPQSAQGSSASPTGLNKGPLPWMCGMKKEPSPPPEFLIYTQKAQDRIQRQRSISQQENRQVQFPPQRNEGINSCENGYLSSTPYSPTSEITRIAPMQGCRNLGSDSNCAWRSPEHQSIPKNQQQQRQQPQYQYYQQQHQPQNQYYQQPQNQYYQQPLQHQQQQQPQNQYYQQPQQHQQQQQPQNQYYQQPQQHQQHQQQQQPQNQYYQQQQLQQQLQQQQQQQQHQQQQQPLKFNQQQPNQLQNVQYQRPYSTQSHPQQSQPSRQTRFASSSHEQTQPGRPRERIIPIMMEDSPPVTPLSTKPVAGVHNTFPNKINQPNQSRPQRHNSWPKPSSVPSSPLGTGGAFSPYEPQEKYQSSSNALEALQQMQQNLAQLNSGLQTAYPRVIHQQLHIDISPSHPLFSAQNQPQQNGAPFIIQQAGPQDPVMQSRSFRVLQSAYDPQEATGNQLEENSIEPKKYMGSHIPSRSFRMLQAMTDDGPGPGESDL